VGLEKGFVGSANGFLNAPPIAIRSLRGMRTERARLAALCGLAILAGAGCQPAPEPMHDGHTTMSGTPSERMHAIMTQPMKSKPTGDVDRDFAAMMAEHHRWAIDMAKIELEHGKNPELKKMAEDVVKAQSAEVEKLEKHAQMKH
jgi:uncharacterized protein (DUF305 family)